MPERSFQPRSFPLPPYNKNPAYHQRPISPIHLSGSVVLVSGASGAVPVAALQNPMDQDMEILEVKFELQGDSTVTQSQAGVPFGGTIWADLTMGSLKITNGAVPVWGFGRAENLSAETKSGTGVSPAGALAYNGYTWRLPRPLFVPAGAVLLPKFTHKGYVPSSINVRVGYSARSVTKAPKVAHVPWVAAYVSKAFNPISAASTDQSAELDLKNDTDKVFNLQRFTGRTLFYDAAGTLSEIIPQSFGSQYLTMRLIDSYGRPLVRTYTPFKSVFSSLTRSWELEEVGAQLDPGGFYRAFLKKSAMTMAAEKDTAQAQAFISMVGWREEKV